MVSIYGRKSSSTMCSCCNTCIFLITFLVVLIVMVSEMMECCIAFCQQYLFLLHGQGHAVAFICTYECDDDLL